MNEVEYKYPFVKKELRCSKCSGTVRIFISHDPIANSIKLRRYKLDKDFPICQKCKDKRKEQSGE